MPLSKEVIALSKLPWFPQIMRELGYEPVKHGHWIFGETMGHSWMKCSECCVSQSGQTATFTYCPNCGARMERHIDESI